MALSITGRLEELEEMANESSMGIETSETSPIENKKPFEKFAADPGRR